MRFIFYIILTLIISKLSGQTRNNYKYYSKISDGFPNITIPFDTVTGTFIDSVKQAPLKYSKNQIKDNLIYFGDFYGNWWTVYNVNKSIWIKIPLPFDFTDSVALINIDKKDAPELIVRGFYNYFGTDGGYKQGSLLIINLNKTPTVIMNIMNYYFEEFSGKGGYRHEYERKITLNSEGMTIHQNTIANFDLDTVSISNVPSGKYKLINDQFIIQK